MFGIRTKATKATATLNSPEDEAGRVDEAPIQPSTSATSATETTTTTVRRSIGEWEMANKKVYKSKLTEAAALQQSALTQLDSARNLRTEIRLTVTANIKRLYNIVKEIETNPQKTKSKAEEEKQEDRSTPKTSTEKIAEQIRRLEKENKKMEETSKKLEKAIEALNSKANQENNTAQEIKTEIRKYGQEEEEREKRMEERITTYAEMAAKRPKSTETAKSEENKTTNKREQMHSIIIKSTGTETSGEILERVRNSVDAKNTGLNVDTVRKVKDQKVIIGCTTIERLNKVTDRLKSDSTLIVETAQTKDPLVVLQGVIKSLSDEEVEALIKQNQNLSKELNEEEFRAAEKYRRRARNPHTENIILQVSPRMWKALIEIGKVLQRVSVQDQSPLIQCSRCLGYGHGRKYCKESDLTCSHCGGQHLKMDCPDHPAGVPPVCVNCRRANVSPNAHNAFDARCPIRRRWDMLARSPVAYC